MTGINEIKAMALAYGACDKVSGISSINDAISLLMTPQGREFALKTGFPTLQIWRSNKDALKDWKNHISNQLYEFQSKLVIIDESPCRGNNLDMIVVGDTKYTAIFDNPNRLYHLIAMHGAKVEINASNYAVVTVTNINSEVKISNDGTAKVTVEQSEKGGCQ